MTSTGRPRGSIRERGATLQVRVFAGYDAVTGKQRYLTESIAGTDRAARRRAEKALTRLQAQVDKQRAPETSVSLARALDEWLATNEIEDTTRRTYVGYIERTIKPAIGAQPIDRRSCGEMPPYAARIRPGSSRSRFSISVATL
jgi:integrase